MKVKSYQKDHLEVKWKPELCIHSAKCAKGLPHVFDPKRRPWIDLDQASTEAIKKQIETCPSGALSYVDHSNPTSDTKMASEYVSVETLPQGPLVVKADCEVTLADGTKLMREKATYFCRCGASNNKPFCDGAHKKIGFDG